MFRIFSLLTLVALAAPPAFADWPQWLGPNRDGVSPETITPWKGKLEPGWTAPLGEGNSSPVIAGGKVFVHYKVKDEEREEVAAFDLESGRKEWAKSYERPKFQSFYGNGPKATPLVNDKRLYTCGASGILSCWDVADGKLHWQMNVLDKFNAKNLFFGVSSSPLIDGDKLIVMVGGKDATIAALNKTDGEVVWKSALEWADQDGQPRLDHASYASPILTQQGEQRVIVCLTGEGVVGLNPKDGKPFWQHPYRDKLNESSTTPVRIGDLLVVSSVTVGTSALKLTNKDGKPAFEAVWSQAGDNCYFSTPVPAGEQLYTVYCVNPLLKPSANLHCIDPKTGKTLWKKENVGQYHASLMRVKNGILMLQENGELVLFEPNAKEFKELARAKVCEKTWAHPALSEGRLVVRDGSELRCIVLRK